jgi:hypothetical protein
MAHPPLLLKRIYSHCLPKYKHCHKRFILERKRIFRCLEQPELEQLFKGHDYGLKPPSLLSPTSQERQLSRERNQCSKSATRFAAATYQVQVGGPRAKNISLSFSQALGRGKINTPKTAQQYCHLLVTPVRKQKARNKCLTMPFANV